MRHDVTIGRPSQRALDYVRLDLLALSDLGSFTLGPEELHEELSLASSHMSELDRHVVFLRHVEGRTIDEIAGELHITAEVTRNRLTCAVAGLRRALFPHAA